MKTIRRSTLAMAVVAATVLSACGGGGDDQAGSVTAFSVVPAEVKVTGPSGACAAGATARIYVYGGVAPYRIDNPFPTHIGVDRTRVDNRGDFFTVTFLGGCVDPATLVVVDAVDKQVTVTLINEEGD